MMSRTRCVRYSAGRLDLRLERLERPEHPADCPALGPPTPWTVASPARAYLGNGLPLRPVSLVGQ
jgi:hypothetical protein